MTGRKKLIQSSVHCESTLLFLVDFCDFNLSVLVILRYVSSSARVLL
jgi:hypothetical protein